MFAIHCMAAEEPDHKFLSLYADESALLRVALNSGEAVLYKIDNQLDNDLVYAILDAQEVSAIRVATALR